MGGPFDRWAPILRIVFVVLMVGGSMLVGHVPGPGAPERDVADYLVGSDDHGRNVIGAHLWVLASLAFLWFLTRLRSDLLRAESGTGIFPPWLAGLALVAAIALLFEVVYGNILRFWAWAFMASVVMLKRRQDPVGRREEAPATVA